MTNLLMGEVAYRRYDHDAAVLWLTKAATAPDRVGRLQAMIRLAQATVFDGDGAALGVIDKALAEIGDKTTADKDTRANFLSVRGRVLMNLGRDKEAAVDLRRALSLSGGLTNKVSLNDVALRSDLAQAMLLVGDRDKAREFLAYTGAGRIEESPFASATFMGVPSCTGERGLKPEDSAVVEFSIGDDGQVSGAQTVYSRGTFAAATVFAQAVRDWTWRPEKIAKLPEFYRRLTRVELHCSNADGETPGVLSPLYNRFSSWATPLAGIATEEVQALANSYGAASLADGSALWAERNVVVGKLRTQGAARAAASDKLAAAAAFGLAGIYDRSNTGRAREDLLQAVTLIGSADPGRTNPATTPALAALRMFALLKQQTAGKSQDSISREKSRKLSEAALNPGLDDPLISADALAQDTLRVLLTNQRPVSSFGPEQTALLRAVAEDMRLEDGHPLRQIALLRLASVSAAAKQYQEAQALFARTGLSEQQCALLGDIPRLKSDGADSSDYPMEAFRMGFEGWVQLEFDIDAAGRTANQRALIAYPPFVFVDAAKGIARGVRYDPTYRPSGKLACSATRETVRFILP
jgi:outer membrane biosynthesis protein TonB